MSTPIPLNECITVLSVIMNERILFSVLTEFGGPVAGSLAMRPVLYRATVQGQFTFEEYHSQRCDTPEMAFKDLVDRVRGVKQ